MPFTTLLHLFRPLETLLYISFPLAGFFLAHGSLPPVMLLLTALSLSMALVLDNVIEGYRIDPEDAGGGDYPLPGLGDYIEVVRKARAFLFIGYFALLIWSSPESFPSGIVLYIFVRLYNDHHIRAKARPPLGLLCHLGGSFSFYYLGVTWWPTPSLHPLLPGAAIALLMGGGYLNHLLLDRERDEKMGMRTLAHRMPQSALHHLATLLIILGDASLGAYLWPDYGWSGMTFYLLAATLLLLSAIFTDPRRFRTVYRLTHAAAGAIFLYALVIIQV